MPYIIDPKYSAYYEKRRRVFWSKYWKENTDYDLLIPNGFREYPEEIYNLFLTLIDRDGHVIDLGCGNGLMLKHLICRSKYRLVPHGVDFISESIEQAKEILHPDHRENFHISNVYEFDLGRERYDYIFFDLFVVHPDHIPEMAERTKAACREGGKIIFYLYRDVLRILRIINLFRLRWIGWVGDLLPKDISIYLERIDHKHVSIGVYHKK